MGVVGRVELESCLRGFYRLLSYVKDGANSRGDAHVRDARVHELRALQRYLVENLPAFLAAETSASAAALRAEALDAFTRISLRITGCTFEAFAHPDPGTLVSVPFPLPNVPLTLDNYRPWLEALVVGGELADPQMLRSVEQRTLQLLPVLDPIERGPALQLLYDAGLIFNLTPRLSLSGAYFSRADLTEALLMRAHLSGANFRGARLVGATLDHATLRQVTLITAQMGCVLLRGADLREAEVAGASMMGAELQGADLSGANLVKTTLRKANLTGAALVDTNLLGSHLEDAVLTGADMRNVNLLWANLTGAILDDVLLTGAIYSSHTDWPEGFDPKAHAMMMID